MRKALLIFSNISRSFFPFQVIAICVTHNEINIFGIKLKSWVSGLICPSSLLSHHGVQLWVHTWIHSHIHTHICGLQPLDPHTFMEQAVGACAPHLPPQATQPESILRSARPLPCVFGAQIYSHACREASPTQVPPPHSVMRGLCVNKLPSKTGQNICSEQRLGNHLGDWKPISLLTSFKKITIRSLFWSSNEKYSNSTILGLQVFIQMINPSILSDCLL